MDSKVVLFFVILLFSASIGNICLLVFHGMLAFMVNVANFNAVKEGGPLMMNVVGNVKQVAMIILSVVLFKSRMRFIGVVGSVICIAGSIWYSQGRWLYGSDDHIENSKARQAEKEAREREEESQRLLEKRESA